jgi:hypothetical protein
MKHPVQQNTGKFLVYREHQLLNKDRRHGVNYVTSLLKVCSGQRKSHLLSNEKFSHHSIRKIHLGFPGFDSRQAVGIFLFATTSRPALGAHPASKPMETGGSFSGGKVAGA